MMPIIISIPIPCTITELMLCSILEPEEFDIKVTHFKGVRVKNGEFII